MPPRLPRWDYGSSGAYFVTMCTQHRRSRLGVVDGDKTVLSPLGRIVQVSLWQTFDGEPGVVLEAAVVMPDHLHLIVSQDGSTPITLPIHRLLCVFRARVTHAARKAGLVAAGEHVWQRGYFDRVIRTRQEHAVLAAYIETNPMRWTWKRSKAST